MSILFPVAGGVLLAAGVAAWSGQKERRETNPGYSLTQHQVDKMYRDAELQSQWQSIDAVAIKNTTTTVDLSLIHI